jgi:hypothetical protein
MRSLQQNKLYHELCGQLYSSKPISIYDGRFTVYGLRNPMVFRPSAFSYDSFRDIMKSLDFDYPRAENELPISSAKLSTEDMNSHITFLEVLLMEGK